MIFEIARGFSPLWPARVAGAGPAPLSSSAPALAWRLS